MSPSISLVPAGGSPRCLFANEDFKRAASTGLAAAGRIAGVAARVALALLIAGLGAAQPRLLPLIALGLPFWLATELEGKIAPRT